MRATTGDFGRPPSHAARLGNTVQLIRLCMRRRNRAPFRDTAHTAHRQRHTAQNAFGASSNRDAKGGQTHHNVPHTGFVRSTRITRNRPLAYQIISRSPDLTVAGGTSHVLIQRAAHESRPQQRLRRAHQRGLDHAHTPSPRAGLGAPSSAARLLGRRALDGRQRGACACTHVQQEQSAMGRAHTRTTRAGHMKATGRTGPTRRRRPQAPGAREARGRRARRGARRRANRRARKPRVCRGGSHGARPRTHEVMGR
jgi:hypothetical protein